MAQWPAARHPLEEAVRGEAPVRRTRGPQRARNRSGESLAEPADRRSTASAGEAVHEYEHHEIHGELATDALGVVGPGRVAVGGNPLPSALTPGRCLSAGNLLLYLKSLLRVLQQPGRGPNLPSQAVRLKDRRRYEKHLCRQFGFRSN